MSGTDWKPAVGDVVRARTHISKYIPKGSIGLIERTEGNGNFKPNAYVLWRRGVCCSTYYEHIKPAKPESLSRSQRLWVVKTLMNGL